jgi:hypothetical protein
MLELLQEHPWLIAVGGGLLIPILGVVFGTVTKYLTEVRRAELEAGLKQEMVQRGMSAEEIKTIIESSCYRKGKRQAPESVPSCE